MIVKQPAVAGTLESSDIQVSIFPNPGMGLDIQLQSNAKAQFGDSIIETTKAVLAEFEITDAVVSLVVLMMREGRLVFEGSWEDQNGDLETFYLKQFGEGEADA